jgi:hypothetical protein
MIRVAWRQFRTQALVTLALLAAFAALVLVTGLHLRDIYHSLGGPRCGVRSDCFALTEHDPTLSTILGPALLAVPALLGMFWGAPLVARELESGTHRLAWTQSVTRRRWLLVRVAIVGAAALVVAGVASWLVSWWFSPLDAVNVNRFSPSVFTARGVVAIGYAGFAFALGVGAGALMRRTLPAMVTTLVGFVATRVAFTLWIRPNLLPAREVLFSVTRGKGVGFYATAEGLTVGAGVPPIPNAWMVSDTLIDRAHGVLSTAQLHDLLVRTCPAVISSPNNPKTAFGIGAACQHTLSHHLVQLVTYQPAGHYWPLQALETGIFLAAAFVLIGITVWLIGPRRPRRPAIDGGRARSGDAPALQVVQKMSPSSTQRSRS